MCRSVYTSTLTCLMRSPRKNFRETAEVLSHWHVVRSWFLDLDSPCNSLSASTTVHSSDCPQDSVRGQSTAGAARAQWLEFKSHLRALALAYGLLRALGATSHADGACDVARNPGAICGGFADINNREDILALSLSEWLVIRFEMQRLSMLYLLLSSVVLLLLGQVATLTPALRASRVPPVEATRSV